MATKHVRVLLTFTRQKRSSDRGNRGGRHHRHDRKQKLPQPACRSLQKCTRHSYGSPPPLAAQPSGGVHATADKNKKRHDLVALLRKLASYVQGNCKRGSIWRFRPQ